MQHDLVLRAVTNAEGVMTVQVAGVIDAHTLDKFERGLSRALQHGAKSLLLDCEELRYVNSAGFGELIRYFDRLREQGGTLVLARVPPKVGIILEMLGLKSLIPIVTSLDEGARIAAEGAAHVVKEPPPEPPARVERRGLPEIRESREAAAPLAPGARVMGCALCDTRMRVEGSGRWVCPSCGAPFTVTAEGGVAFDWSASGADAVHLTIDVTPRTLAAFAGMLEGILVERRVAHSRLRRFAREAAHVCHLLSENAYPGEQGGPLHVLALAGPQRLQLRIVDRGRPLGDETRYIFGTQTRLFLDFRYRTLAHGVNATEFAFAYAEAGATVST